MNLLHRTTRRVVATAAMLIAALLFSIALPASASAATADRHTVKVFTDGWVLDHSVEIWNRSTGQRVWRSDGPQLNAFKNTYTYSYTYRGGNEYLRVQVRAKAGPSRDVNFLNIRCNTEIDVWRTWVQDYQRDCV